MARLASHAKSCELAALAYPHAWEALEGWLDETSNLRGKTRLKTACTPPHTYLTRLDACCCARRSERWCFGARARTQTSLLICGAEIVDDFCALEHLGAGVGVVEEGHLERLGRLKNLLPLGRPTRARFPDVRDFEFHQSLSYHLQDKSTEEEEI